MNLKVELIPATETHVIFVEGITAGFPNFKNINEGLTTISKLVNGEIGIMEIEDSDMVAIFEKNSDEEQIQDFYNEKYRNNL